MRKLTKQPALGQTFAIKAMKDPKQILKALLLESLRFNLKFIEFLFRVFKVLLFSSPLFYLLSILSCQR